MVGATVSHLLASDPLTTTMHPVEVAIPLIALYLTGPGRYRLGAPALPEEAA